MPFFHRKSETVLPNYQTIPELLPHQLPAHLRWLADRRSTDAPSYGAYIVRGQGADLLSTAVKRYGKALKQKGGTYAWQAQSFDDSDAYGADGIEFGLHKDTGDRNDITLHATTVGKAVFALLPGHADKDYPKSASDELLQAGTIDGQRICPMLRTVLEAGDLVMFDHTEYHAFASLTPDRASQAHWFIRHD